MAAAVFTAAGAVIVPTSAATATPTVATLTPVAGLDVPVDVAWRDGDAALYVVSQSGSVTRVDGETTTVVLDVSDLTEAAGEQGLLGLAFGQDGTTAYVNYTDDAGDTNIVEFTVAPDGTFQPDSRRLLLLIEQPYDNHNGGGLASGPDGMLYAGIGDGGSGGDPQRFAQNLRSLLGKMLRIDPTTPSGDLPYTIPADNPYVGNSEARGEIWSVGLRNPWRFSFDAETGDLWIADVGQNAIEEIDFAPATDGLDAGRGSNFGWSGFEGSTAFNDDVTVDQHTGPIFEYSHDGGRCSISGGVRPRGAGAGALAGSYVYADFCTGEVLALTVEGGGSAVTVSPEATRLATAEAGQVTQVTSSPDGTIYVLSRAGTVFRLDT